MPRFIPRLIPIAALIFGVACTAEADTANTASRRTTTTEAAAPDEPAAEAPATTDAPATTAAPTTTTVAEDPEVAAARGTAGDYLDSMGFCRPSLIDQLEFEGYSNAAAVAAVDSLGVDWQAQTIVVAQNYVDSMDFSHAGLVDQLEFEGCEPAHAEQAATQVLGF